MWNKPYHEKLKVHSLYGHLLDMNRLRNAWKKVKSNDGAGGVDKVTLGMFECQLDLQLKTLQRQLQEKTYLPQPVRRVPIEKDGSDKLRNLGIPTVRDRIVQQVVKELLEPIFDPHFSARSHGYRPGHSQHGALDEVKVFRKHFDWVLDADIKGFFDNVNHEVLLDLVNERVSDGMVHPSDVGTPQGGVISPLLANIYLHHLDRQLTAEDIFFVRYADDMVLFCESRADAEATQRLISEILENELHVELSAEKTKIVYLKYEKDADENLHPDYGPFEFLGFRVSRTGMSPCERSINKFKNNIREVTIRHRTYETSWWIRTLNSKIRGWCNYFGYGTVKKVYRDLSGWIRTRVRLNLGSRKKSHIRYNSRCMKTLRQRYTNAVLRELGLITPDLLLDS